MGIIESVVLPGATVLGTVAAAVVYLLSLTVVFGIVPTSGRRQGHDR